MSAVVCCTCAWIPETSHAEGFDFGVLGGGIWPNPFVRDGETFAVDGELGFTGGGLVAYRLSDGRVAGHVPSGAPICLLTTTGRSSGKPRTVPVQPAQSRSA